MRWILCSAFLWSSIGLTATDVDLQWTPVTDQEVAGYEIHYGNACGVYTNIQDVPGITSSTSTIPQLEDGQWCFAARSRNADSTNFSVFSNTASTTLGTGPIHPSDFYGGIFAYTAEVEDPIMVRPTVGTTISSGTDSTAPFSDLSHTVDSSTDVLVVAAVGWGGDNYGLDEADGDSYGGVLDGATWTKSGESGQAMTVLAVGTDPPGAFIENCVIWYYLVDPNIGAGNISFGDGTMVGNPSEGLHFIALNIIDVDTTVGTNGIRDRDNNSSTSGAASVTLTSSSNDLVLAAAYRYNGTGMDFTPSGSTIHYGPTNFNSAGAKVASWDPSGSTQQTQHDDYNEWIQIHSLSIAGTTAGAAPVMTPNSRKFQHILVR